MIFLFIGVLFYYGFNCPPNVTVEDSGDFIMGLSTLGIVHGPSFPLFTMLGFLFSKIPIGEMGFRIALYSSFFGAIGISLFYYLLRMWGHTKTVSIFVSLGLAVTSVYMGQSIIAEVYSLNLVFVLLLFIFSKKASLSDSPLWVFFMGLTVGSGLIHHYPLFIASCTGLVFIFDWKKLSISKIALGILGAIIGIIPFLYLVVQMKNPDLQYNFGKVTNWEMLWKQFLRKGYQGVDEAGGGFNDKLLLSWSVVKLYFTDFKAFLLLIPLSFPLFKINRKFLGIHTSFITSSYLIVFLLGFKHEVHYEAVIKAYLMPHMTFLAIYIALGLDQLKAKWRLWYLPIALFALLVSVVTNFKDTSHFKDDFVFNWSKHGLESLEPNSVLILCGQEPYALYYTHKFFGVRPDVTIYDRLSIMTEKNLYEPELLFWKVKTQKQFEIVRKKKELEFFKNSDRPIYMSCSGKFSDYGFKIEQTAYFYRLLNHVPFQKNEKLATMSESVLQSAVKGYPKTEYWLDSIRNMVLFNTYSFYLEKYEEKIPRLLHYLRLHKNSKDQDFLHSMAEHAYNKKNIKWFEKIVQFNIEINGKENLGVGTLARLCTVRAQQKQFSEAQSYCESAIKKNTKACNLVILNNLMFVSYHAKNLQGAKKWAIEIIKCKPDHKGANSLINSIK